MSINRSLLELNLAVLLISTSGLFGRLITLTPELTIFYRCLIAAILLGIYIKVKKIDFKILSKSDFRFILLGGLLMTAHWVAYFYSLALSSVAIALLTLHAFPAFTAILEPIILKTKFKLYHLLLAGLVIAGVSIILPSTDINNNIVLAIILGLTSALGYALRNIFTKKIIHKYNGSSMMCFQLIIMTIVLSPFLFVFESTLLAVDWKFILLLAFFTTALGHTLLVKNLKSFSATTVGLISSIVPVYGILWGLFLLNETPTLKTLIGGGLIMLSFMIEIKASSGKEKT